MDISKTRRYRTIIPIVRKNFNKTKSAKFKGQINIVSNQYGIIYDWHIEFKEIWIDLYTTPRWIKDNDKNFIRRKKLFKLLSLKQEARPIRSSTKIIKLNIKQISIVNNFLNDRTKYNSTIKNILAILKGSNPGGEAKKPSSAEMIIDGNVEYRNFVVLLDDLVMKYKITYESSVINSQEISLFEFIRLNNEILNAFKYMQMSKQKDDWLFYLKNIKEYYKKYNADASKANSISQRARNRFGKNIDAKIKKFPFNFTSKHQFQKSHIYEFHDLRDKITECIFQNKKYDKYLKMIEDENNFLPLPEHIHRKFDANYFTYNVNGEILPIHKDGEKFIMENVQDIFKKIPDFFLNKKRIEYINRRNAQIKLN